jgi:hypothetical protein
MRNSQTESGAATASPSLGTGVVEPSIWRTPLSLAQASRLLFEYLHNLKSAVLMLAAGLLASEHEWGADVALPPVIGGRAIGYIVTGIGIGLVLLNLIDGLKKLRHVSLGGRVIGRIGLTILSLLITLRVVQVLVLLRLH